jgi:hypothetical protein
MALPYQIIFSASEIHDMAKQANERIKETVSFYVNHFYKLILAKILVGESNVPVINFNKFEEEKGCKFLKEGIIVRVSRGCDNYKKCLGPFNDFRNGIVTSVLDYKGDTRYFVKVIGEKACAISDIPTNVYDSEKTYLRDLLPTKPRIGLKGRGFQPIVDEEKLHLVSSTLYSADELEVGSFEERYKIITETMSELETLLGIDIIRRVGASIGYPTKYTDYMYKVSWKSEEELKQDQEKQELGTVKIAESDEEYANFYDLQQFSSTPEKELRRLGLYIPEKEEEKSKSDDFPNVRLADLVEPVKVIEESRDEAFS